MAAPEEDGDVLKISKNANAEARPKYAERFSVVKSLASKGKLEDAVLTSENLFKLNLKLLGPDNDITLYYQEYLAFILHEMGRYEEAKVLNERAVSTRKRTEGLSPPTMEFLQVHQNLARDYRMLGKGKRAAALLKENYDWRRRHPDLGEDDEDTLKAGFELAASLRAISDFVGAEDLDRKTLAKRRQIRAPELDILLSREALGTDQIRLGKFKSAKILFEKNIEILKAQVSDKLLLTASEKSLAQCCEGLETQEKEKVQREGGERESNEEQTKKNSEREAKIKQMKENAANYDKLFKGRNDSTRQKAESEAGSSSSSVAALEVMNEATQKGPVYGMPNSTLSNQHQTPSTPRSAAKPSLQGRSPQQSTTQSPRKQAATDNGRPSSKNDNQHKIPYIFQPSPTPDLGSQPTQNSGSKPLRKLASPPQNAPKNTSRDVYDNKANIINVEFRPRSSSHNSPGPSGSFFTEIPLDTNPSLRPTTKRTTQPSEGNLKKTQILGALPDYNAPMQGGPGPVRIVTANKKDSDSPKISSNVPTINEPAGQLTTDITRTKSVMGHRDKLSPPSRPRSASPASTPSQKRFQPPLFDAEQGKHDEKSAAAVDLWFYDLECQTQELLKPLRKDRCKRVRIAILDTGIDLTHPQFLNKQSKRIKRINTVEDFVEPGGSGQDTCGHGTHCLGLLRQVAPEADIYVARVVKDSKGKLDPNIIAKAINRACRSGKDETGQKNWDVDIISMSCGFYSWVQVVKDAIDEAVGKPTLIFAAASNNGTRQKVVFPAYLPNVICVNSATADGASSTFNPPFEASRSFSILGENVSSTWITSEKEKRTMSGTSVATPIAAATAALLLEFALQNDPSDEVTDKVLKDQLHWMKKYDGIIEIFSMMSEKGGKHRNIIPWNVLSVDYDREDVARMIKVAMTKKFGSQAKSKG